MTTYSHATSQTQENSSNISFSIAPPPATYTTTSFQHSSSVRRKHLSDIGRGDRYIVDILGALRDSEQSSSGTVSQSESVTSTLSMMYGRTTDALQDQSRVTQQKRVTSICVSTLTPTFASVSLQQNQTNTFTPFVTPSSCTPSEQEAPTTASSTSTSTHPLDLPAPDPAQHPTLDQTADMQRVGRSDSISSRSDSISSVEKSDSPTSDDMSILSRESSSHSLNSSLLSAPSPKKERRSSRLLGKFMPKFLHSSHGHSSSSSSSTSSSQSTGVESHLGNPTDTKSGSTTDDIYNKSVLPPLSDTTSSPLLVLPDSVIGMDHDWLVMKSDMGTINSATSIKAATPATPVLLDAAPTTITIESPATPAQIASSYSSYSSHNSFHSFKIEDYSEQSTESFKEAQERRPSSHLKVKDEVEEVREYAIEDEQSNEADYSSYSPYTIDEDDDDFFRNSVLRKKTRPHSMMPSISIGSSYSSSRRTPSLSTSFTSSSQASSTVPSPTTSLPLSTLSPTPVSYGIDEKRSRLSDAVKEWRRSASASLGSTYSMTYSGFSN
ncbi:hypothetical protein BGZ80_009937 [Entomortierella chlamydospora]|uniref:Uncharacterized protein n=1 Tax=Entomortierella chlamydospora TaxID=101097 RepID=A0A9P6MWG2_9FUNG|nr:hypothetical protein BGZ79_005351 [Entomortierella chlamydospora]KAG0015298.1 hypothetical protein BGZ80_009937 [Entomortierella chlamydospora]